MMRTSRPSRSSQRRAPRAASQSQKTRASEQENLIESSFIMRLLSTLFLLFSATGSIAQAGQPVQNPTNTERPTPVPVYTSLIVTACPKRWGDTTLRPVVPDHPDYDHWQKPDYTGCQDVPVPSWAMTWDFTPAACKSIPGYNSPTCAIAPVALKSRNRIDRSSLIMKLLSIRFSCSEARVFWDCEAALGALL